MGDSDNPEVILTRSEELAADLREEFGDALSSVVVDRGEVTVELPAANLLDVCTALKQHDDLEFTQLTDLCGVDYLSYGEGEWDTSASSTGFSRGVDATMFVEGCEDSKRFAVVYQLISMKRNQRLRLRVFPETNPPMVDSVENLWPSANWAEREAYDLFGILFSGNSDLRRILTDYGFIGHPFRKDFPLTGHVEVRYDPEQHRVVYEPTNIEPRVLVPKVIRAAKPESSPEPEVAESEMDGADNG